MVFQSFYLDIGCIFSLSPFLVLDHVQRNVLCLLIYLTLTYESFKHKKAHNSRDEPELSTHNILPKK